MLPKTKTDRRNLDRVYDFRKADEMPFARIPVWSRRMGLTIWFVIAALSIVFIASAQSPPNTASGLIILVSPLPGAPLSAEQSEERTQLSIDGTKTSEVTTGKIFRDSRGRIRAEPDPANEYTESMAFVTLADPGARSVVILFPAAKMAFHLTVPASAKGFGFAFPSIDGELIPGRPNTKTDDLGKRMIEGIEFRGTRTELTDQTPGSVVTFTERWYSEPLALTASVLVSHAMGSHSATLKHVHRGEPDPALFAVPPGYVIQDLKGFPPR